MTNKLKIGDNVEIISTFSPNIKGAIEDIYYSHGDENIMYIVKLTKGFYSVDKSIYVSYLIVHPDNIRKDNINE